ncbi:hypothetical protein HMPREF9944_00543 [Segatella maculosa OT 289]|uniref:Uncharacterized protein n=1 Tax=Segatella maculosa OT 289 TaxID=999422 RepID=H1HK49_9BACT|nr:hypothetical protein HMPREF9944_00543 [Segatella maculosa OT 289]
MVIKSYLHGDKRMRIGGKGTECLWKDYFPLTQATFLSDARMFFSDASNVSF